MKLFLTLYLKITFIYLRLHVFFNLFQGFSLNLNYLSKLPSWANKNRIIEYNDFPSTWNYEKNHPRIGEWLQNRTKSF